MQDVQNKDSGFIVMMPLEADVFGCSALRYRLVVCCCCLFFVLFALCVLLTYLRQALLDISNSHNLLDFTLPSKPQVIVRPGSHLHHHHHNTTPPLSLGPSESADPRRALRRWRRKRGKKGGLHARLKAWASRPPLPSLLLANVRYLENKLDELRAKITTQEIRKCFTLIFTKTRLSVKVPECAV